MHGNTPVPDVLFGAVAVVALLSVGTPSPPSVAQPLVVTDPGITVVAPADAPERLHDLVLEADLLDPPGRPVAAAEDLEQPIAALRELLDDGGFVLDPTTEYAPCVDTVLALRRMGRALIDRSREATRESRHAEAAPDALLALRLGRMLEFNAHVDGAAWHGSVLSTRASILLIIVAAAGELPPHLAAELRFLIDDWPDGASTVARGALAKAFLLPEGRTANEVLSATSMVTASVPDWAEGKGPLATPPLRWGTLTNPFPVFDHLPARNAAIEASFDTRVLIKVLAHSLTEGMQHRWVLRWLLDEPALDESVVFLPGYAEGSHRHLLYSAESGAIESRRRGEGLVGVVPVTL